MKEFITAAREDFDPESEEALTFKHDGREVKFYRPSAGQFAILTAASINASDMDAAGTYIALFFEMADPDTARYFRSRLFDRTDPFDMDSEGGVIDIMDALVEEWSARPTKSPSDYRPPQSSTGRSSTAPTRARASTSSPSRRAGSSR